DVLGLQVEGRVGPLALAADGQGDGPLFHVHLFDDAGHQQALVGPAFPLGGAPGALGGGPAPVRGGPPPGGGGGAPPGGRVRWGGSRGGVGAAAASGASAERAARAWLPRTPPAVRAAAVSRTAVATLTLVRSMVCRTPWVRERTEAGTAPATACPAAKRTPAATVASARAGGTAAVARSARPAPHRAAGSVRPRRVRRWRSRSRPRSRRPLTAPGVQPSWRAASSRVLPSR